MKNHWRLMAVFLAAFGFAAAPNQGPELESVMREKLEHAQKILEAVVTDDWVGLESHSRALERLTDDPRWTALKFPAYARHSAAFMRAIQALHRAAAQRDVAKTPPAYIAVILRCVECHRYLARARITQ